MKKKGLILLTVALLFTFLSAPSGNALESRIKGKLPSIEEVFAKLFSASIRIFSLDQLKKESTLLSEEERCSMINFLGKERLLKAIEGLDADKKNFLTDEYMKLIGKGDLGKNFRKFLPRILAINANIMSVEQVKQSLKSLDEAEMGTLTIYMGNDGLKVLFNNANRDKHEAIMSSTPDWVILEMGLLKYDTIKDYTATMLKQEKIGGKMQGVETIELKYRVKPTAIYAKWINGPFKGRECLYNSSVSTKNIRVRESPPFSIVPVTVPLDSLIAKRGTNHLFTEVGLGYMLELILRDYLKASPVGDLTRKDIGVQEIDGKPVFVMESTLKKNPKQNYYCHRLTHYIDYINSFEVKVEVYDWNNQMFEMFTYLKIRENAGLKDIDFDQNNPAYKLK